MTTLALRMRQARRRRERGQLVVEIGHEPPISLGRGPADEKEHFRATLRWMASAAIGGLSGAALLAAAIYLGFDAQSNFAESPEFAVSTAPESTDEGGPARGDRLVRPVDIIAAKQTFRAETTITVGEKEVVKARLFTHVSTTLGTTPSGFADAVPPFNPQRLTAGGPDQPEAEPDPGPVQDDAEVTFAVHDLAQADMSAAIGELSPAEIDAQVAALLKEPQTGGPTPSLDPQDLLRIASDANGSALSPLPYATTGLVNRSGPYGALAIRITTENVTAAPRDLEPGAPADRLVPVRHGETLEDILRGNGAPADTIKAITAAFGGAGSTPAVKEGQKLLIHFEDPDTPGKPAPIARVGIVADEHELSAVAIGDEGGFSLVSSEAPPGTRKTGEASEEGGMSLYESVYESALKQGLAKPIIEELVAAFASDVDYQRAVAPGDAFEAFYSMPDDIDPKPVLLFASLTVRDQTFRYYRFRTPDDGLVDFYDETGKSSRKFLIRKPIVAGEMTSPFGMRFHPILHYARMHNGVDWANAIGTPILAAGNGVVAKAEFSSGYGRRVEIQHANGYMTTYSHLSGFAQGVFPGAHVRQGQVIGYLGDSGLATGPHLHYEVIINGNFVDPMGIKLARTREFDGKMLALFKRERERIDQLMSQAPNATTVASNVKTN